MTAPVGRACPRPPPPFEIVAAILAGGRASRWNGLAKGLLRLPSGSSLIERTIAVLVDSGLREITIFVNDPAPYQGLGRETSLPAACQVVPDHRPGQGPLGGIEAALLHYRGRCDGVLVLPCDLPGITGREISRLRRCFLAHSPPVVVAETDACPERSRRSGFWQPLCAVVRADMLPAVSQALDEGRRGVYRLWRELGALPVRFPDPTPFFNLNSPADLVRWLACRAGKPMPADSLAVAVRDALSLAGTPPAAPRLETRGSTHA